MHAGLPRDVLSLLLGFLTGMLSALFGIGGAIVSNPGLRALGAAPLVAVGTTLPSILPLAFTAWRTAFTRGSENDPSSPAGAVDDPERLNPRPATLPLRGASHRRVGLSRANTSDPGSPRSDARQRWSRPGSGWLRGCCRGSWGSGVG
jgi:hypothetical protein